MKFLLLMSLYLLGSASGASGDPDKPPGSVVHQAAVKKFSGEPFSLATPSDIEALYEVSSGKNDLNKRASDEHAFLGRSSNERGSGKHAAGEHTAVSEHVASEHSSSEQPSDEQASSEQASSDQASSDQASSDQASGEQASGEQASGEQAASEQSSGEEVSSPAVDCHTCSYMNDAGKCLRGEGVCTTQNSQQCMLKKIFEGGKLQFMVQGCENMCPSMSLFSHGTRMHIICCRSEPFCNKL
uniref:Acrosomal vesicle protein 1 n=1 Tax=Molossus molossus TaxID=27622 RepID=A0A7J8BX61_MOLMO|nr:acrosomal vesicle protein 1 [Molossus molossus]